jgi:hypothetical protein
MRQRWLEIALASVMVAGLAFWALMPLAGRPGDVELQVEVKSLSPLPGNTQRVAATVRWHWRRQPLLPLGARQDGIGFVFDEARWTEIVNGGGIGNVANVMAQYGEAVPLFPLQIGGAQDGELTMTFASKGSGGYQSRVFPLRVQFIHMQGESGWVRAQGQAWPL